MPPARESFGRTGSNSKTTNLNYSFRIRTPNHLILSSYRFSSPQNLSDNLFSVQYSWSVHILDGFPVRREEVTYGIKEGCISKQQSRTVIVYNKLDDSLVAVEKTDERFERPATITKKSFPSEAFEFGAAMVLLANLSEIKTSRFFNSTSIVQYSDEKLEVFIQSLTEVPSIRRYNTLTNKIESLQGVTIQFIGSGSEIRLYQDARSGYELMESRSLSGSTFRETITKSEWLNEALAANALSMSKMVGFRSGDFGRRSLSYQVTGFGQPKLFNPTGYFKSAEIVQNGAHFTFNIDVEKLSRPLVVPWGAPVSPEDHRYLVGSKYIQLDKVADIASRIRPRLRGANRLQASKLIIEEIVKLIAYDDSAVRNELVGLETTEDILRRGKGVCQHFSVVFVAVSRALGIPARIIDGWFLTPTNPIHHVWVEVKANDSTWWPLDPQRVSDGLTSASYFPIGEMRFYERESEDPTSRNIAFRDAEVVFNLFAKSIFTKL